MDRRPLIVVGAAAALLASAFAVRKLLEDPCWRRRLGFDPTPATNECDGQVDLASEDSFPASDPPSFTATTAGVGV
ncbi:hypothetical protein EON82_11445 [bacterium]|nr:MAG: hypothetical protein EON82_11445 [bacterium]